jgi:spore photoproduct lyase
MFFNINREEIMWTPKEIFIHTSVKNDPVTANLIASSPSARIVYTSSGMANIIKSQSEILKNQKTMLNSVLSGKDVVYIAPVSQNDIDSFEMPDQRMNCPAFARIKHASNGCFYKCDWCYLKLTYRSSRPYITIKAQHDELKRLAQKYILKQNSPIMFNSGELADSLSLEHLSMFGRSFIPWFGQQDNAFLFMLTKSDNVDHILNLQHNGKTVISWSLNAPEVSSHFEVGAPSFEQRLKAAKKVQDAGYRIRFRLDPILPFENWKESYAKTVEKILKVIKPERITLGTLRFEKGFYIQRASIFTTNDLINFADTMIPMFEPLEVENENGKSKISVGKYSFQEIHRIDIFNFAISEIRKFTDVPIALCKESSSVWTQVGLDPNFNQCVCQI